MEGPTSSERIKLKFEGFICRTGGTTFFHCSVNIIGPFTGVRIYGFKARDNLIPGPSPRKEKGAQAIGLFLKRRSRKRTQAKTENRTPNTA